MVQDIQILLYCHESTRKNATHTCVPIGESSVGRQEDRLETNGGFSSPSFNSTTKEHFRRQLRAFLIEVALLNYEEKV